VNICRVFLVFFSFAHVREWLRHKSEDNDAAPAIHYYVLSHPTRLSINQPISLPCADNPLRHRRRTQLRRQSYQKYLPRRQWRPGTVDTRRQGRSS
jgi:hypothetical protein